MIRVGELLSEALAQLDLCAGQSIPCERIGNFRVAGDLVTRAANHAAADRMDPALIAELRDGTMAARDAWTCREPANICAHLIEARQQFRKALARVQPQENSAAHSARAED